MVNYSLLIAQTVVGARNGEAADLAAMKQSLARDPSRADPHLFTVTANNLVEDSLRDGPQTRLDVYPKIPALHSRLGGKLWDFSAAQAIAVVGRYPSLADRFAIRGYREIDELEDSLINNDALATSDREKILKRVAALGSDRAPVWQNWIRQLPRTGGAVCDAIIQRWLAEPIDWQEQAFFDPARLELLFGVEAAVEFFSQLGVEHRSYFGVELADAVVPDTTQTFKAVFLQDPIADANRRAQALGVKFRFAANKP